MKLTRIPQRLEHVRARRGVGTLQEFHELVGKDDFSYSAVRNYHFVASERAEERSDVEGLRKGEREAPVRYLTRVSKVFNVRLEWLALGTGPVTEEDFRAQVRKEEEAGFGEFVAGLTKGLGVEPPRVSQEILWSLRNLPDALEAAGLEAFRDPWFMGDALGRALRGPLAPMHLELTAAPWDAVEDYLSVVALGVVRLIRANRLQVMADELKGEPSAQA